MHISLDDFVAASNGEMNRIKVDEEIFDHAGKQISKGDTALCGAIENDLTSCTKSFG